LFLHRHGACASCQSSPLVAPLGIRGHAVCLLHQHGPRLFFRGLVGCAGSAAHQSRLGGFCSSFLRHSSLPWWSRHVCWMFNSWVGPASRAHFCAVRSGSRSLLWPLRPTSFTFPLPPASALAEIQRCRQSPSGAARVQAVRPKSNRGFL